MILDVNGIHEVALDYCDCETAKSWPVQLLRRRWYPATTVSPQTAATFNVLEFFQLLTFESKASAFEVYHTLKRRTDNIDVAKVPVSYCLKIPSQFY